LIICYADNKLGKAIDTANFRLIQTDDNKIEWLPISKVEEMMQECGKKDQGFFDVTEFIDKWESLKNKAPPTPSPLPTICTYDKARVDPFLQQINMTNWEEKVKSLSALGTRYYNSDGGVRGAELIFNWLSQICGPKCTPRYFTHPTWPQPSVILRIPGTTEENEIVIFGAHQDSIASNRNIAPGADDDASGTSALIEIARVLIENNFAPTKSVEFQFYAAEEVGLWGSQAIATAYAAANVNVYSMMQLDMIGFKGSNPIFVADFVDIPLTNCLRVIAAQLGTTNWGEAKCGYACSDHASYFKAGYRSSHPFESTPATSNNRIHTAQDLITFLDTNHAKLFVELGVAAAIKLAQ